MQYNELPVAAFRNQIVETVATNDVVIITAETGAGKSTQVPKYLLDEGYEILVTQPRRLAARSVAARVSQEYGTPLGGVVGFRTAYERQDSKATRCLFVTDGLAMVRELLGAGKRQVLILDEVHEWNLNIEVLVAWAKKQIEQGADFKLVLMSATLEAERLAEYFGNVPVISVPGRIFPVEEPQQTAFSLHSNVADLLRQGRNVLVFQPGKQEIAETIEYMEQTPDLNAEILPLHGELSPEEQARCFASYRRPKCVVSTNVAQTSVTIDDIDAVVDSGNERRIELVDGIEGLYLRSISLADREQRKGRAGRTKPGVYFDWCDEADRPEYPIAEILRVRIDQMVLRLADVGIDAEALEFFHQPDRANIHEAKRALIALGCMRESGKVTKTGRRVAQLPVSVRYGRMVIEAERLGVVNDIITVTAIMEQGGILANPKDPRETPAWRKLCKDEADSDVMAQLAVWQAAMKLRGNDQLRENGILVRAYHHAKEKRRHLKDVLKGKVPNFTSSGRREAILKAVCAGMVDHLYYRESFMNQFSDNNGGVRTLDRKSVIDSAEWVIGEPWDLQVKTHRGPRVRNLLKMVSKIQPNWLIEVAPQLVKRRTGIAPYYDATRDVVVSVTETYFNGHTIGRKVVEDPSHPEARLLRREGARERQWQQWDFPKIQVPDLTNDRVTIPRVEIRPYGTDVETDEPLLAYGTLKYSLDSDGDTFSWFTTMWTRNQDEAEQQRSNSVFWLRHVRSRIREQAILDGDLSFSDESSEESDEDSEEAHLAALAELAEMYAPEHRR